MGNICRSPAAHIVMTKIVKESGFDNFIEIDSAGTIGYHSGNAPDSRMSQTLEVRGYPIFGAARQITKKDLEDFDLILTMDDENFANVHKLPKSKQFKDRIHKFTDFCENFDEEEVPDPYYGGKEGFELVVDLVEDGCDGLLQEILRRSNKA